MATFTWIPDRKLKTSETPRILEAKFGDGYSQRAQQGINNIEYTWDLKFTNRYYTEANAILDFLKNRAGVESFYWTPPSESTPVKVICTKWDETYITDTIKTVTMQFKRVYE